MVPYKIGRAIWRAALATRVLLTHTFRRFAGKGARQYKTYNLRCAIIEAPSYLANSQVFFLL